MDRKHFIKLSALGLGGAFLLKNQTAFARQSFVNENNFISESHPIVIIGSGYGGSVAALRLCNAGKKVVLLEMGLNWQKSNVPFSSILKPGKSAAWLRKHTIAPFFNYFSLTPFTGVLDRMEFDNMRIWMGRGVGGGSLVNGGMSVVPQREYFREVFPQLNSDIFYQKYYPLVQKELKVNTADEAFLQDCPFYKFSKVGEKEAQHAGFKTARVANVYDFDYMQKEYANEAPRSALGGELIYGNNYGKNSLDKTYLKQAAATGNLTILDLHQVMDIQQNNDDTYSLNVKQINECGETMANKVMHCKKLVVAAGTMGSLELLMRSKAKGQVSLDDSVGKNWGNNGNFMTGRNWVQAFSGGLGANQSTLPVAGIDNWHDAKHPFFTEIAPFPMGMNVATALYLMINRVDKKGAVSFNTNTDKLELNWDQSHTAPMRANAEYFVRTMNKANGGTRSHLLFKNGFGADICYHPLGGIVLGKSTNAFGKLHQHNNLFVLDGSLIPGTIGVNPLLTITAIAEYCMENLLQQNEFEVA